MRGRKYKLEILWDNGVLTEDILTEEQLKLLKKYRFKFLRSKFILKGGRKADPYMAIGIIKYELAHEGVNL